MDLVLKEVNDLGIADHTSIQSFAAEVLEKVKQRQPEMPVAWLLDEDGSVKSHLNQLSFTPEIYSPNHLLLTREKVAEAQHLGAKVIPWTVNEEARMRDLIAWGVDGIITDYPDRLRRLLDQLREEAAR